MTTNLPTSVTEPMLDRIRHAYLEMPRLRLTLEQAQLLWGLDQATCSQALEFLVEVKFLCCIRNERQGRFSHTAVTFQRPEPADLDRPIAS